MGKHKSSAWGLIIAFALISGTFFAFNGGDDDTAGADVSADQSEDLAQLAELLTVETTSEDAICATNEDGIIVWNVAAVEEDDSSPRLWSDSISTPMQATEPESARDEVQEAVCEDPLLGVSGLVFFATDVRDELLEKRGIDIVELNPWLKPFAVDPSEINSLAAEFIPLLDVEDPTDDQVREAAVKNQEWQELAAKFNTLLDRFEVTGIEARQSIVNYHLAIGGLVSGALPAVERNPNQEGLPALVLSITEKDQCEHLLVIGFNMGDKRPELFEPPICEEPPPTVTSEPPTETTTPPGTTPTTRPPRTTTTTVPPTTLPTHPPADGPPPVANQPPHAPPSTTPTTAPTGSTPTDTVPACGLPGQPSCDNTGVTPPTTVAPPAPPPPNQPPQDGEVEGP